MTEKKNDNDENGNPGHPNLTFAQNILTCSSDWYIYLKYVYNQGYIFSGLSPPPPRLNKVSGEISGENINPGILGNISSSAKMYDNFANYFKR